MPNRWKYLGVAASVSILALSSCSSPPDNSAVVTEVVIADSFPATHPIGIGGGQPFREYLEEQGPAVGLEVNYYGAGQLGKQVDALHLLRSDAVQVAPLIPAYLETELRLTTVGELPGLLEDACSGVEAIMPMMEPGGSVYEEEISELGVVPLWGIVIPGYEIYMGDSPVQTPDDIEGKLIRSPGGTGDRVVRQLGAAPVSLPAGDVYEAVARATIDGASFPPLSATSYSLQEVLRYGTTGANLTTQNILYSISEETWSELTDAQKQVFLEAAEIAQEGACQAMDEYTDNSAQVIRDAGVELFEIDDQTRHDWVDVLEPVQDSWLEDVNSVGMPGDAALEELHQRLGEGAE